ncbi:MAG: hypothetical protein HRT90_10910 [Candidatus Margulisbacteria bacterium]|nr:hypothetical protein [Candidatus Margulisiibacteriota bacterium]
MMTNMRKIIIQYKIISAGKPDPRSVTEVNLVTDEIIAKQKEFEKYFIKFLVHPNKTENSYRYDEKLKKTTKMSEIKHKACLLREKIMLIMGIHTDESYKLFLEKHISWNVYTRVFDLKYKDPKKYARIIPIGKFKWKIKEEIFEIPDENVDFLQSIQNRLSTIEHPEGCYTPEQHKTIFYHSSSFPEKPMSEFAESGRFHKDDILFRTDFRRLLTITFTSDGKADSCLEYIFLPSPSINSELSSDVEKIFIRHVSGNIKIDEIIEEAGRNLQLDFMEDEKNKVVLLQLNPGHAFIGPGNTLHRSPPNPTCEERLLVAVSMEKSLATVTTH